MRWESIVNTMLKLNFFIPNPKQIFQSWQSIYDLKIATLILGVTMLGLGATALMSYGIVRSLLLNSLKTNAMIEGEKAGDEIDQWLSTSIERLQFIANSPEVRSMDWSVTQPYLELERERLPDLSTLVIAKPNGSYYSTAVGFAKGFSLSDRLYFQKALAGVTNVDDPVIGHTSHIWQTHIGVPIWSVPPLNLSKLTKEEAQKRSRSLAYFDLPLDPYQKPKIIGVCADSIPIKHLSDIIQEARIGDGSYAFALDSKGNAIAHPDKQLLEKQVNFLTATDPALAKISQEMVQHQRGIELVKIQGKWVYVAYLPLSQAQWSVALVIPRANIEDKLIYLNLLASFLGVILIIATLIAIKEIQLHEQTRVYARKEALQAQELAQTLKELQQTQAQLIQTEKMSSLGQMVAGVAHEINNPVNFIHGNLAHVKGYTQDLLEMLRLYQQYYPNSEPEIEEKSEDIDLEFMIKDLPKTLESMKVGADRIRQIVLSLRNFSRLDEADRKKVDIHEGIDSTLLLLQNKLKAQPEHPAISIVKKYGNLPKIECYAGQLNQVFMNIINNAIDALDSYNTTRSVQEIHDNQALITIYTEVTNSHHVTIKIADNGPGMTEEVRQRIFDPFFTTKPVGKGTGLGLSISYQIIVEKHGGVLQCFSEPGRGTEFWIEIPVK